MFSRFKRGLFGFETGFLCFMTGIAFGQSCDLTDESNTSFERRYVGSNACVERGKDRPVVDGLGLVFGIPSKVLLWDRRALNHNVSDATVAEVTEYLDRNHLPNTVVRINQYAPLQEWNRLTQNRNIAPGWRYSVGALKWMKYTLVPGRLFGKDEYNPFTNSLYLYSDMPILGLSEAAYARDVSTRERPGTYAATQELPLLSIWHETLATGEVQRYVRIHGSSEDMNKIRHDLYARYGMEIAGSATQLLPDGSGLFAIIGAVGGHGAAKIQATP